MNDIKTILQSLSKVLPAEMVKTKPGFKDKNGQTQDVPYLEWFTVADILDECCPDWKLEIVDVGEIAGQVFVRVALTIQGIRRENIGFELSATDSYGDPFSNAFAMAFKRTSALFGLGRYLYKGLPEKLPEPEDVPKSPQGKQASERQRAAILNLLTDQRLTPAEVHRLNLILSNQLTADKASEVLDYFLGKSVKQNGRWIKVNTGALAGRPVLTAA